MEFSPNFSNDVDSQTDSADKLTLEFVQELDSQKRFAELINYKQNTAERKIYAERIFQFTCFWCIFVGSIILFCGLGKLHLSDLVLTTLLGTTTVNAFGFFLLVTKYLFNEKNST